MNHYTRESPFLSIAVDGPAGAGKSTAARDLARLLNYRHIDTGAMYRAAALGALDRGLPLEDETSLRTAVRKMRIECLPGPRLLLNGRDVTGRLRTPEAGQAASRLSAHPTVRKILVDRQKRLARGGGVVMEGRDIGTVVLPRADVKFFLDASPEERGRRRWKELRAAGARARLADIVEDIRHRDHRDRTRAASPLRAAEDAVVVDTTRCTRAQVTRILLDWIRRKRRGR
jgi:cytidylate kinase